MADIIDQIQAYDIPHTSYLQAVRYMRAEHDDLSLEQSMTMIHNLTGWHCTAPDGDFQKERTYLILLYIIQETIRMSKHTETVNTNDIVELAQVKAMTYYENHPWEFIKYQEDERTDPITGKIKMKKGKKQEMAAELYQQYKEEGKDKIIEVFQEELDMSKAGARTYFYNMRKKFGDV